MKWIKGLMTAAFVMGGAATAQAGITFRMLSPGGGPVGTDTSVTGGINSGMSSWSVASTTPFFGLTWTAHDGTLLHPGTYTIPTVEGGTYTGIVIEPGHVGGHILFNWGTTTNIDVVVEWDAMTGASLDVDGNGIDGLGMIDGAFPGFNANFDMNQAIPFSGNIVPEPMSMALVGSSLVGLVGLRRKFQA